MLKNKIVLGTSDDDRFEFVTLTEDLLDRALELFRDSFCQDEEICICAEVPKNPEAADELTALAKAIAQDNITVVAVEKTTGKVVAAAFNKMQVKQTTQNEEKSFFAEFAENCKHPSSRTIIKNAFIIDSKFDVFEHYKVDCLLELFFLVTDRTYRGNRLGQRVCEATVKLAEEQAKGTFVVPNYENVRIGAISVLISSPYSYKIFLNLGFDEFLTVKLDEFEFNGKKFSELAPLQQDIVYLGKKIG